MVIKNEARNVLLILLILLVPAVTFAARAYISFNVNGVLVSSDGFPISSSVKLNCSCNNYPSSLAKFETTTTTDPASGAYLISTINTPLSCPYTACTFTCTVIPTSLSPYATSTFQVGPFTGTYTSYFNRTIDVTYQSNLDFGGTFSSAAAKISQSPFIFTFTPSIAVNDCRFSTSSIGYYSMTAGSMTKNGTADYVGNYSNPNTGEYTSNLFVSCQNSLTTKTNNNTYTFDFAPPKIVTVSNTPGYYSTVLQNMNITTDTLSKCSLTANYSDANKCQTNYSSFITCPLTFTPSPSGSYDFPVSCIDETGNKNNSAVIINYVIDITPPSTAVSGQTAFEKGSTGTPFNWTLEDPLVNSAHPGTYYIYLNNTQIDNNTWDANNFIINSGYIDTSTTAFYNYTLYVKDFMANTNSSTVFVSIGDTTPPLFTINTPINNQVYSSSVLLNLTSASADVNECFVNATGSNTTMNRVGSSFTLPAIFTNGSKYLMFYCNDTSNNLNSAGIHFTIDAVPPVIISPGDKTFSVNSTQTIIFQLYDFAQGGWYYFTLNGTNYASVNNWTSTANNVSLTIDTNRGVGLWNYTIFANDSFGNTNTSAVMVTIIDDVSPVLTINSPSNNQLFMTAPNFNITTNEAVIGCNLSIDNLENQSMAELSANNFGLITSVIDGSHNVTFYCTDNYNNKGFNTANFSVDLNPPYIISHASYAKYSMNSTNNISWVLGDAYKTGYYKILINDTLYTPITSWVNNSLFNITVDTNRGISYWNYTIVYNDSIGRENTDSVFLDVVDDISPAITIKSPGNNEMFTSNPRFNITVSETVIGCGLSIDYGINQSMDALSGLDYGLITTAADGNHNLTYYCTDNYNNVGTNSTTFRTDTYPPYIITAPLVDVFEFNSTGSINWTIGDSYPSTGFYYVLVNGTAYYPITIWANNSLFNIPVDTNRGVGLWNYSLIFNDSAGHTASNNYLLSIVDTLPPIVGVVIMQDHGAGTWILSNITRLQCTNDEAGAHFNFAYALDDYVWTNITGCQNDIDGLCDWTIPRETKDFNISCTATDNYSNTGGYAYNNYAGLDMSPPTISLIPFSLIYTEPFTISVDANDAYIGVANVTYWYTNITGSYLIGTNNTSPFNYTWTVPFDLENKYINISASAYDYAGWGPATDTLSSIGVNMVEEPPVAIFSMNKALDGNTTRLLDATGSYDNDFAVDNTQIYYNYQISNDNNTYTNITGCTDINTTCLWDTTLTYPTCMQGDSCYVRSEVYDYYYKTNSNVEMYYIDNTPPGITLNPLSNHIMSGDNQTIICQANDTYDFDNLFNMTLIAYFDNGTGYAMHVLNTTSNTDTIRTDWMLNAGWPNQQGIIIQCSATDGNNFTGISNSTSIGLERVGPYFWNDSMNVSQNSVLGIGGIVKYSDYVNDTFPGVDQVYFDTSNGLLKANAGMTSGEYYYNEICTSTNIIIWNGTLANDTIGNPNITTFATPHSWYCDTSSPEITSCGINTSNTLYKGEVSRLSCTVTDIGFSTVNTVLFTTNREFKANNTGNTYFEDFICNESNSGNYTWSSVFANDSLNNSGQILVNKWVNCDANPPVISSPIASPDTVNQYESVCITVNVTDNNPNMVRLNMRRPDATTFYVNMNKSGVFGCGGEFYNNTYTYGYNLTLNQQGVYYITQVYADDEGLQWSTINPNTPIFSMDNQPPIIENVTLLGGKYFTKGWENSTFRASVYDQGLSGVDKVLFEFSGVNETGIYNTSSYYDYTFTCAGSWEQENNYTLTHVIANDTNGNKAAISENISIVCDTKPPLITDTTVNSLNILQYDSVCISANVTDSFIKGVWANLYINGTLTSINLTSPSPCGAGTFGAYYTAITQNNILLNSTSAIDFSGNYNESFANITVQVVASFYPSIMNCTLNNSVLHIGDIGKLSCDIRDNEGVDTAWFSKYDNKTSTTSNITMSTEGLTTYYYNFACDAQSYNYTIGRVFANDTDTITHTNSTIVNLNVYCDMQPPKINNIQFSSNKSYQYSTICVNATITDDMQLGDVWLELYEPYIGAYWKQMSKTATCAFGNNTYGADIELYEPGFYEIFRIGAVDYLNNYNETWINQTVESVDNSIPSVIIQSPVNATYGSSNVTLTYYANNEIITNQWYVLDANPIVYSGNSTIITGLSAGSHKITTYINDTYGNVGSNSVMFTINTTVFRNDLQVNSLELPYKPIVSYPGYGYYLINSNITNKGDRDAVDVKIKYYDNGVLFYNDTINILFNATTQSEAHWQDFTIGLHNITVIAEPQQNETNVLDNSKTGITTAVYLIDDVSVSTATPDTVAPNTSFITRVYEYSDVGGSLSITNHLIPHPSLIINGDSFNTSTINWHVLNTVTYHMTSPGTLGTYYVSTDSWINGFPGNKTTNETVEVINPHSPLFSIDLTIIPPSFEPWIENTVIADIFNYGNTTAHNVNATLNMPAGISLISGNVTQHFGDLVNGSSIQAIWTVRADYSGSFTLGVNASCDEDTASENQSFSDDAILQVDHVDYPTSVKVDGNATIIVYINNAGGNATNVNVQLVPAVNMTVSGNQTLKTVNIPQNSANYSVSFDVNLKNSGDNQAFKLVLTHTPTSYYEEYTGHINVWRDTTPPSGTPVVTGYSTVNGKNVLQWTPISEAYYYYIYKGINGETDFNKTGYSAIVPSTTTSWIDNNVELNKWYYYRITAVDEVGNIGNFSEYVRVIPVDTYQIDRELEQLQRQLDQFVNNQTITQREEAMITQIDANISRLYNDILILSNISRLLTPEQAAAISSIRHTLIDAKNQEDPGLRKTYLLQAEYEFALFNRGGYSVGLQELHDNRNAGNLSIDTTTNLVTATINGRTSNKYTIIRIITNPTNLTFANITLQFPIPNDAVFEEQVATNGSQLVYNMTDLAPGVSTSIEYTYYTYSNFDNNERISITMVPILPPAPLEPVTGFISLEKIEPGSAKWYLTGVVWIGVIILTLTYFFKGKLQSLASKIL
ncbi:Uncharacterised protein [Candidatus Tiddalikarchaeum anstoanum]|nr:Uncharacterised protein [Candidatus Tiddalikarchaeum anstoanum]